LLLELVPGGAKRFLTRGRASHLLATVPTPVDIVTCTRHPSRRQRDPAAGADHRTGQPAVLVFGRAASGDSTAMLAYRPAS
jgi:hypothetical protein